FGSTVDPRRRLEPLERLVRLGEQRLGLFASVLSVEPLSMFELRNSEPEDELVLAEDLRCTAKLAFRSVRRNPRPEARGVGGQHRRTLPGPELVDRVEHALEPRGVAQRAGALELLDNCQLHDDEADAESMIHLEREP